MKIEPIDFLEFQTNRGALIAAFKPSSKDIWKEESATEKIDPVKICDGWEYMPWGIDNPGEDRGGRNPQYLSAA